MKKSDNFSKRIIVCDAFRNTGKKIEIAGWVKQSRALGKIKFIVLRDLSGEIQITAPEKKVDKKVFEIMGKIPRESVISVVGEIKDSKQAPGGKEIIPNEIVILNKAEEILPIDVSEFSKTELPKRLDYKFLDLHRKNVQAIFKIQSTILQGFREFMIGEKAIEAVFPSIISSSSEGGTELYKLKYFEKDAYLSQSCQLYKQMLACSMEKVFTVFTVWRAEKHNTTRHLNESRQLDFEMAFADEFVVMDVLARCVQYIIKKILKENKGDLKELDVKLVVPKVKYLTFEEVVKLMKKNKIHMDKDDLSSDVERKLGELYSNTIIFVHDWPIVGKPFYIMPKGRNLSAGFDAIYRGTEISSGGQRVHLPDLLTERLKVKRLNPKHFESYIESFKYGAPPHAGWGMGLERLTMLILGLSNIREAVLFPRDRDRLVP